MAEALFLVERTEQPVADDRDGVRAVIINNDDTETNAQHIAAAVLALNTALPTSGENKFPAGYFDTVTNISDLVTAGALRTDGDFLAFKEEVVSVRS